MAVGAALLAGCGDQAPEPTASASPPAGHGGRVTAHIPPGWEATRRPVSGLLDPKQLLTLGSFDLNPGGGPPAKGGNCTPAELLKLLPGDGALITVTVYSGSHLSPQALRRLPPKPSRLRLSPRYRGMHECGGNFDMQFREGGRGYIVDVWLDPQRVDPQTRRQADRVLASLAFPG
jgi:hypothetical protein